MMASLQPRTHPPAAQLLGGADVNALPAERCREMIEIYLREIREFHAAIGIAESRIGVLRRRLAQLDASGA